MSVTQRIITQRADQQLDYALGDPVAQLPFELSSKIFVHCLPPRVEPGPQHIPMLLLNVCRAWSYIALSTPTLWATIHVVFPHGKYSAEFLEMWLRRAGSRPLSISLRNYFGEDIAAIVGQYTHRITDLEISHDDYHSHVWISLASQPFPFLKTLTLAYVGQSISLTVRQILEILRHAPNLVECTFDCVDMRDRKVTSPEKLVLPALRRLYFGKIDTENDYEDLEGDGSLLTCLTLPNLQTLVLPDLDISDVASFMIQSSPPLRELLLLGIDNEEVTFTQLDDCLRLSPFLVHFEFHNANTDLIDDFLAALEPFPSTFLPNLRILKIHQRWYSFVDFILPSYGTLLRVLSARRSQIVCCKLVLTADGVTSDYAGAERDQHAAFRQLIADGMEVHIGDDSVNFLATENGYWGNDEDSDADEDDG